MRVKLKYVTVMVFLFTIIGMIMQTATFRRSLCKESSNIGRIFWSTLEI